MNYLILISTLKRGIIISIWQMEKRMPTYTFLFLVGL